MMMLPFFAECVSLIRIQTNRGTEYCDKSEANDYQLSLALNDLEQTHGLRFLGATIYNIFISY